MLVEMKDKGIGVLCMKSMIDRSCAVGHIDEMLEHPLSEEERAMLAKHLDEVKDYPFFNGD